MRVRIRFSTGPRIRATRVRQRHTADVVGALLTPAAVMAAAFGLWRIAAGWNWTGSFAITSGFFSHWQAWLGAAALLELCARALNRRSRGDDGTATP